VSVQLHTPTALPPGGEIARGTHWIGNWVGHRACLDDVEKRLPYGLNGNDIGVRFPAGPRDFSPRRPDRQWGPPSLLSSGYRGRFPYGVKRPECEADHSPPSSAEVKNVGAIPPRPHRITLPLSYAAILRHRAAAARGKCVGPIKCWEIF
jgi:hypothetical protein